MIYVKFYMPRKRSKLSFDNVPARSLVCVFRSCLTNLGNWSKIVSNIPRLKKICRRFSENGDSHFAEHLLENFTEHRILSKICEEDLNIF